MQFTNGACTIACAYPMQKRRSKRTAMTDRGMVSLLAAVEVASNNSPPPSDQRPAAAGSPTTSSRHSARAGARSRVAAQPAMSSPEEPRKGARVFSAEERVTLDAEYARNKFPTRAMMAGIAQSLRKPHEKVRTWFNNRRALDRKLGIDVIRHPSSRQHAAQRASTSATAAVVTTPQRAERPKQLLTAVIAPVPPIVLTPETPRWPSSPVTDSRRMSNLTPAHSNVTPARPQTPSRGRTPRHRLTPVRLRAARLRLGRTELRGDGHKDEVGLEVKFLFRKRRLVYEWYCGDNYKEAAVTGGPYAKMEINFDSLFSMRFLRTRDGSIIEMSLSDAPALYRQTEHNMLKFKVRSQQRQYQKTTPDRLDEDVTAKDHCIHLRSDDAARIKKTILESVPELAQLVQESTPQRAPVADSAIYQNDRLTDSESNSGAARTEPVTPAPHPNSNHTLASRQQHAIGALDKALDTPQPAASPSEPSSFKSDVRSSGPVKQTATTKDSCSKDREANKNTKSLVDCSRQTLVASSRGHVWETPTRSNLRSNSTRAQLVLCSSAMTPRTATGPENTPFLIPTPAPWQSPATPVNSEIRGTNVNYWLASGAPAMGITPLADRPASTPISGPLVRRALDFTPNRSSSANGAGSPPSTGRKRRLELNDENDASASNKKPHLMGAQESPVVRSVPPPPMPPPLPPPPPPPLPSAQSDKEIQAEARTKEETQSEGAPEKRAAAAEGSQEVQVKLPH